MKTIQNKNSKEIKRVSDKTAEQMVDEKSAWNYVPKEVWKKANGWIKKKKVEVDASEDLLIH